MKTAAYRQAPAAQGNSPTLHKNRAVGRRFTSFDSPVLSFLQIRFKEIHVGDADAAAGRLNDAVTLHCTEFA